MKVSVARVLNGFLKLNNAEREEFIRELNGFQQGSDVLRKSLTESVTASVTRMQTGPHGDRCECCGR